MHADTGFVVADKPAGQLSVPGRGPLSEGSLAAHVEALYPGARTVHRLDMATSGLLLFARDAHWQRVYSRMFAARQIDKRYLAIVRGRLGPGVGSTGTIDLPLAADWPNRPRQQVDWLHGKPSLTHWSVVAQEPAGLWTRVELTPVTGRTHQLRVHLMAIGHPIVGDTLYGAPVSAAGEPALRLMLHAGSLSFDHPVTGHRTDIEVAAPF